MLYILYLAKFLTQDPTLRFGYVDNINLYHTTDSLDTNVNLLASDVQGILV